MYYPNLPEPVMLQLRVVLNSMRDNPTYLDGTTAYSDDLKDFLKELDGRRGGGGVEEREKVAFDGEMDRLDYVETEIVDVMSDLRDLVGSLGNADHSEKLQVAKARAGLIEKLTAAREKIWTMKQSAEFQGRIVGFLDEICTKDQIQELKKRIKDVEVV